MPDSVVYHDETVLNPSDEILAELGYLELVETMPPESTGYVSYYVEEAGKAVQYWEIEPPVEPTVWVELDAAYQEGVDSV